MSKASPVHELVLARESVRNALDLATTERLLKSHPRRRPNAFSANRFPFQDWTLSLARFIAGIARQGRRKLRLTALKAGIE
jgi:hypothetical protein